jgi:hypothetical protein
MPAKLFAPRDRTKTRAFGATRSHRLVRRRQAHSYLATPRWRKRDCSCIVGAIRPRPTIPLSRSLADGKFGAEFAAETFTLDQPLGRLAVVKYLSDTCRGIGTKTAERLFEKFGPDAVRVLREEPKTVADAGFLSPENAAAAAEDLAKFARFEHTKVELFGLFAGQGFHGRLIDRCIAEWGVGAAAEVRANPFELTIRKLPSAGFKRCDKLYLDLKHDPAAPIGRRCARSTRCSRIAPVAPGSTPATSPRRS